MLRFLCLLVVHWMYFEELSVLGDTPANCTYEEIRGKWTFFVGDGGHDNKIDCSNIDKTKYEYRLTLEYPDVVKDEFGNKGFWTLIYNQGFEVVIHGRKFFAFSKYEGTMENSTSYCSETLPGWTHDVLGNDWACYYGKKEKASSPKINTPQKTEILSRLFIRDDDMINEINRRQSMWTAGHYPEYETMTLKQISRRTGGSSSRIFEYPYPARTSDEVKKMAEKLPKAFDWRNVDGRNYVSPIRDQGGCGSCYAFASAAMNEARLRVATNNTVQLVFSTQDIVDCSHYSQGCNGGFPYLVGGKYAEDYGMVEEDCNPYEDEESGTCGTKDSCKRHYFTKYQYIGGYYGACNEESMMLALFHHGPIAVSFKVYSDMIHYTGGIYRHTGVMSRFNPFQLADHVVAIVGYGVDNASSTKFWIVKNSWGESWGENGYFRIRKGYNEVAIESIAVQSFVVF